jgi:hypothetical protein
MQRAMVFLLASALSLRCNEQKALTVQVAPSALRPGPIRHAKLADAQLARIEQLQKTFSEVDPNPLSQWVEDFSRDMHPEREIHIWEIMAAAYTRFVERHALTLEAKKEVYSLVLQRSGATEADTLAHLELRLLTTDEAKQIISLYGEEAQPILIKKR